MRPRERRKIVFCLDSTREYVVAFASLLESLPCRHFLNTNGVPSSAVLEMEMPLFLQTERNTGYCWLAIDDVSARTVTVKLWPCRRALSVAHCWRCLVL